MANLHVRSNSLPSKSHPVVNDVEDHLLRLKSSEEASTPTSSVCEKLASLIDLHEGVDNLMQMASIQQALSAEVSGKWFNELLEKSLGLVDLCGFARDVLTLSKGSIQELQSTIRRKRNETSTADDIDAYMVSRKKLQKTVRKFIKNFNSFTKNSSPFMGEDSDLMAVSEMLKETADFDFSILKSVLMFLCGEEGSLKKRSWSFLSMLTQTNRVKRMDAEDLHNFLKQLKSSEMAIQEIEEQLEVCYRTLVKARVSLLNALNH